MRTGPDILTPEYRALSQLRYRLQQGEVDEITDFDQAMVTALVSEGVSIQLGHAALSRSRHWFCEAWYEVERMDERFQLGFFGEWEIEPPEAPQERPRTPQASSLEPLSNDGDLVISEVLEAFIASRQPNAKDQSEIRGYVRRLIEEIGDVPVRAVKPHTLDNFLVKLRKFPVTKRPDIRALPFGEIIQLHGGDPSLSKVGNKTIRTKWFGAFNRLFGYAVHMKYISENPLSGVMPKKSDDVVVWKRKAWSPDHIASLFSKPLFTGATSLGGYRDQAGSLVSKDARYWLPLVALWTGMRLDEIGATRRDEFKNENGVWFFDLRERPLKGPRRVKNAMSRRIVPVHQQLVQLGFVDYAAVQTEWVFPDLPHGGEREGSTTAQFSKWFGRWRRANGLAPSDGSYDFHSFRHTFKDACRRALITEDVHDLLTGHAGSSNQRISRNYRGDDDIAWLAEVIAKVEFPTFPDKLN